MQPLPEPLRSAAFTLADLRAAGRSVERARRADVQHPHHGVHLAAKGMADAATLDGRCRALLPVLGAGHAFSHATALKLWGAPLPGEASHGEELHVTAVGERGRLERPGVTSWETGFGGVMLCELDGLPIVSPADAWAQVSGGLGPGRRPLDLAWLVAIGDFLLTGAREPSGQRRPLCHRGDLVDAARRRRGKRGAKLLSLALELVRPGPQSPRESELRVAIIEAGLPEPVIQVPVTTALGLRHSDLGYPDRRLLLEYQGDHHRTSRAQWLDDLTRVQLFEDAGYRTLLVGDADLHPTPHAFLTRLARALR
jgi:hypothetical protein